jgi:hypothetical protein
VLIQVHCLHNSSELVLQLFALHAFEACICPSLLFFKQRGTWSCEVVNQSKHK